MKITPDALLFFQKMFLSCYTTGSPSSERNKLYLENLIKKKVKILDFKEFCFGLEKWEEREVAIVNVAEEMQKNIVDKDVLINYFAGKNHSAVIVRELEENSFSQKDRFFNYTVIAHALIPLRIIDIDDGKRVISGIYENDNMSFIVRNILFAKKDRLGLEFGKTIFCHYPMVIETDPDKKSIEEVLRVQIIDDNFKNAAAFFYEKEIDNTIFPYFIMLKQRM